MTRGLGELAAVAELPSWLVALAALVTQFGDVWFVFCLLGLLYWFGNALPGPLSLSRRHAMFAVALALVARAVTTTFKELFALPRPPGADEAVGVELVPAVVEPLYVSAATADGFGFPSGHATAAILVYGGLALLVDSRRGYVAAGALVAAIPVSRVVLGVHYLVDIAAGLAFGGAFLAGVYLVCGRGDNPGRALMVAVGVSLLGAGVVYNFDTMAALGGALGARIAWGSLGDAVVHETTTQLGGAVAVAVGLLFGAAFGAMYVVEPMPAVGFLGMAVVLAGVIAAPLVGEAVARRV
ncbi:phosphatase PAP2 family protein [Natronomonas gomsonensis]|uniref:phosphatase PAP2 family protein n=1 Tax=Natronomonas gomsonensis TaxID=1046043 RepID=UPI0015B81799|nr:phosphatase PAP2 family protein [Natronomonas gomsonensis]